MIICHKYRFKTGRLIWPVFILLISFLNGCATHPSIKTLRQELSPEIPIKHILDDVPFISQDLFQCGPASLATILNYRGINTTQEELRPLIYIPERGGSLQSEIRSSVRKYKTITLQLNGGLKELIEEIASDNPVLVMQNLGFKYLPQWHYAVVVGYDLENGTITLRSGRNREHLNKFKVFMNTWKRSNYWGVIIPSKHQLPNHILKRDYITQVSALEKLGFYNEAEKLYLSGVKRWESDALIHFGLGNVYYQLKKIDLSESYFRQSIQFNPNASWSWSNLGHILREKGCNQLADYAESCATNILTKTNSAIKTGIISADCKPVPFCPKVN